MARHVASDPDLARSALDTAPKVDGIPPWTRYDFRIACPLLGSDGACSIYEVRPRVCRAHVSYEVKLCEEVLFSGHSRSLAPMMTFGWPRSVSKAIHQGVTLATAHAGLQADNVEMTAALALILRSPKVVDAWLRGEQPFPRYEFDGGAPHGM